MPKNLKPLTAMRFFAAMWVVAYHFWPGLGTARPLIVAKGYLGVDLFFVLSGFILCHVYLRRLGERRFSYAEFLWARLARLYPTHLVTLIGIGALVYLGAILGVRPGGGVLVWSSLPAQLTLTQAWGLSPGGGWNHPAWSISAEWFAYLCFPAFAATIWTVRDRPRLATLSAVLLAVGVEIGFYKGIGLVLTSATLFWGGVRILPPFAIGCAVYLLWSSHPPRREMRAAAMAIGSALAVWAGIVAGAPDWVAIVLFGGLIFGLAGLSSAGSSLLSSAGWVYLGEISFAVYMVGVPWEMAFDRGLHWLRRLPGETLSPLFWSFELIGVVPAAILLHHAVERPARNLMRRHGPPFLRPRSTPAAAASELVAASP